MSLQTAPLSSAHLSHPPEDEASLARPVHGHAHHHESTTAPPALRIGISVLRMSVATRLAIALLLLTPLWIAVALVAG